MKKIKVIFLIIIFTVCFLSLNTVSIYAKENITTYNISTNRGPRLLLDVSNSNNMIINVKDYNGIKSVKIEKYLNSKWIDISKQVSISENKHKILIPAKIISDNIKIRVTAIDNSSMNNYLKETINITKLSKPNSKGNYFSINRSPRIDIVSIPCKNKDSIDSLVFKAKDGNKIKNYSIVDINNNNKTYKYDISNSKEKYYIKILLNKLKIQNGKYYIILKVTDNTNNSHIEKIRMNIEPKKSNNSIKYIAHRGDSSKAPENTIEAFKLAGESNVFGIETDIQSTSDGELICMHDATVDRTTNGTGKVSDKNLNEIKKLKIDTGSNIKKYNNLSVPTFDEYLDVCKKYNCYAIVELKSTLPQNLVKKVINSIESKNMKDKSIIISFKGNILNKVREIDKSIKMGYIVKTATYENINQTVNYKNCLICPGKISEELIKYAKTKKVSIDIWTLNNYQQKAISNNMGVDYITTNNIDM